MNPQKRTVWSDIEIEFLVSAYKQTDKPRREDILKLIPFLEDGRTIKQIKNWFMNQRQKAKKTKRDLEEFRSQVSTKNRRKSNADSVTDESSSSNPNRSFGSLSLPTAFSSGAALKGSMQLCNPIMSPFVNSSQLFYPFMPFFGLYNPPTPLFLPFSIDLDQTVDFSNEKDLDLEIFIPEPIFTGE